MSHSQKFWDRLAERYSRTPVRNQEAYERKLELTRQFLRPDSEVLEFGCGTGTTAVAHAPHVKHIRALDVSAKMLGIAKAKVGAAHIENISFEQMAIEDLASTGQEYDVVLGLSILHLLEDPKAALAKVHRLLKPEGVFVSSTACAGEAWSIWRVLLPVGSALGLLPHVNFFSRKVLVEMLQASNFEIEHEFRPSIKEAVFIVARKA